LSIVTIEHVGVIVEAQAQISLLINGNMRNYVKVCGKGPIRKRSKGYWNGPQSTPMFNMFYKNNAFTAYFDLKFLLKNRFLNYCKVCWCVLLLPLCRGQSATSLQYYSNMIKM